MLSTRYTLLGACALLAGHAVAQATSAPSTPTEVTGCHTHSDGYYCFEGDVEWEVTPEPANTDTAPEQYTDCEAGANDDTIQCADGAGNQVTLVREGDHDHDDDAATPTTSAATGAAATPSAATETPAGAASNVVPASGVSLFALLAYLFM